MRKKLIGAGVAAAVVAMMALATPAFADGSGDDPNKVASGVPDAPALGVHTLYMRTGNSFHGVHPNDTIFSSGTLADSRSANIHPAGGSTAALTTGYNTNNSVGFNDATLTGTSYGKWLGASPTNATSMRLVDTWSVAAAGSVTVGVPPSVGFSIGSNSASWSTSVSNNWQITHSFNGVKFTGALISETEDSSVTATFGSQSFLVNN